MNTISRTFIFLAIAIFTGEAGAQAVDALTGVRVALISMQSVLAAPPLPSLESEKFELTVQAGLTKGNLSADRTGTDGVTTSSWHDQGDFKGHDYAIGLATPAILGRFRAFGIFTEGTIKGDIVTDANHASLKGIQTDSKAMLGAISWRVLGEVKSPFALALFGGFTRMEFTSTFHFEQSSSGVITKDFSTSPVVFGPLAGAQVKLRISPLIVSPYGYVFKERSRECRHFNVPANNTIILTPCDGDVHGVRVPGGFSAYGLILGWKNLSLNVYSKLLNDESLRFFTVQNYHLSYAIEF